MEVHFVKVTATIYPNNDEYNVATGVFLKKEDAVRWGEKFVEYGKDSVFGKNTYKIETRTVGHLFDNMVFREDGTIVPIDYAQDKEETHTESEDMVNHPDHYGGEDNPYEAIKVIDAWGLGFALGNAVKYISRAGKKDPSKKLEDLRKARWYLDHEIEMLMEQKTIPIHVNLVEGSPSQKLKEDMDKNSGRVYF